MFYLSGHKFKIIERVYIEMKIIEKPLMINRPFYIYLFVNSRTHTHFPAYTNRIGKKKKYNGSTAIVIQ